MSDLLLITFGNLIHNFLDRAKERNMYEIKRGDHVHKKLL